MKWLGAGASVTWLGWVAATQLGALPVGFGYNQGPHRFNELRTRHFWVYHDAAAPHEAAAVANALEAARPHLQRWLGSSRVSAQPVILSAHSDHASFANFVTDALELQTLGRGGRDLAWHELTHSVMYQHFDTVLGRAGAILYLPWVPAWWIEGLAEALSHSVATPVQHYYERYHAASGDWPRYDRLFNLYGDSKFSERGYAVAGSFVTWLLRRGLAEDPKFLENFMKRLSRYASPLYYPWSLNPASSFMPFRAALQKAFGMNGRQLYAIYQRETTEFWQRHQSGPMWATTTLPSLTFSSPPRVVVDSLGLKVRVRSPETSQSEVRQLSGEGEWLHLARTEQVLAEGSRGGTFIHRDGLSIFITPAAAPEMITHRFDLSLWDPLSREFQPWIPVRGEPDHLSESGDKIVWTEHDGEQQRLCFVSKDQLTYEARIQRYHVRCPVQVSQPQSLTPVGWGHRVIPGLGVKPRSGASEAMLSELTFRIDTETLLGDRSELFTWDAPSNVVRPIYPNWNARTVAVSAPEDGTHRWVVLEDATHSVVIRSDENWRCLGMARIPDRIVGLSMVPGDELLVAQVQVGSRFGLREWDPSRLPFEPCQPLVAGRSPLQATLKTPSLSLREALKRADSRAQLVAPPTRRAAAAEAQRRDLDLAPALDQAHSSTPGTHVLASQSKPHSWRGRSLFAFPWLGAEDPEGTQIGLITVPLMDHLQNETVQGSFLYGIKSQFPHLEFSLRSTRWTPTLELSTSQRQTWDGYCVSREEPGTVRSSYFADRTTRLEVSAPWPALSSAWRMHLGYRSLTPTLATCSVDPSSRILAEVGGAWHWNAVTPSGISYGAEAGLTASRSLAGTTTLAFHRWSAQLASSVPIAPLRSRWLTELSGNATAGSHRLGLQEFYTPLRTFIAGSGKGVNETSFALNPGSGLFSPSYGDTKALLTTTLDSTVWPNIERQIWLLYLSRLRWQNFYRYGGAWTRGVTSPAHRLIRAAGTQLRLDMENKGVTFHFHCGLGRLGTGETGAYVGIGFDAFI